MACRPLALVLLVAGSSCMEHAARDGAPAARVPPAPASGGPAGRADDEAESPPATSGGSPTAAATTAGPTAPDAGPAPRADEAPDPMKLDGSVSTSIGSPNDGRLEGGVPFPWKAAGVRLNPRRLNPEGHYATVEIVQALLRAAAVVDRDLPGGELVVNDLSFAAGGPMPHHGSHRSGRDVDVLFYLLDAEGRPMPSKGVPLDTKGRGFDFGDLVDPADDVPVKLDVPRTWRFLQALVEDEQTALQRAFVAEHLRSILVDHAAKIRAPRAARERAEMVTCQPGTPHDDHFHLRFFCTPEDIAAGCEDSAPIYPWRRAALRAAGADPVLARRRPAAPRSRTVSAAEARAKAGPMHWKVKAFLDLRETWSKTPHPGRPYCR